MAIKGKILTPEQQALLRAQGMDPRMYNLVRDLPNTLIVFDLRTYDYRVILKNGR